MSYTSQNTMHTKDSGLRSLRNSETDYGASAVPRTPGTSASVMSNSSNESHIKSYNPPKVPKAVLKVSYHDPRVSNIQATNTLARLGRSSSVLSFKQGGRNLKVMSQAFGDLVIPRVNKWDWSTEMEQGGVFVSTVACIVALCTTIVLCSGFIFAFSKIEFYDDITKNNMDLLDDPAQVNTLYTIGVADHTFDDLAGLDEYSFPIYALSGGTIFLLYVFDFYYGEIRLKILGFILLFASLVGVCLGTIFFADSDVFAPLGLSFAMIPLILGLIKALFFGKVNHEVYLLAIALGLLIACLSTLALIIVWVLFNDGLSGWGNTIVKRVYFDIVNCNATGTAEEETLSDLNEDGCPEAFLVYVLPMVVMVYAFIFTNVITFTVRAKYRLMNRGEEPKRPQKRVERSAQLFILGTVAAIAFCWIAASLFANQLAAVSNEILYLSAIAFSTIVFIVVSVFGIDAIKLVLVESPLGTKVVQIAESDWIAAAAVFLLTPVMAVYLGLSYITQAIRRYTPLGKPLHKTPHLDENTLNFKVESLWLINRLYSWDWGSVLHKVLWIGVGWFVAVIGIGRAVNVLLSFMSEVLESVDLLTTTFAFIGTGLGLFMLPPVPGLPIYLTGGVLLSQTAEREGFSFALAGCYSVAICSLIKMMSIVLQQKVIGQMIGANSVAIRATVNVNALEMRAMRKIMAVPGWTIPKVAVLVGGPDWPTSVLTGIMKLPLSEMLLGSIPVLITIVPVSFAGAVLIKQDESDLFAALNPVLLSISVVVQLTPFFVAVHYIAKAAVQYEDELKSEPLDSEVEEYMKDNETKKEWAIFYTQWENVPPLLRKTHIFFAVICVVSNMSFLLLGDLCFEAFEVTDRIGEDLDGNVLNLVKRPVGLLMVCLVFSTFVYLWVFGKWRARKVAAKIASNERMPEEERPQIEDYRFGSVALFSTNIKRRVDEIGSGNWDRVLRQTLKDKTLATSSQAFDLDDEDVFDDEDGFMRAHTFESNATRASHNTLISDFMRRRKRKRRLPSRVVEYEFSREI